MNFEDCIKNNIVKKMQINESMSKSLARLAEVRFSNIKNLDNPTLKVESYYEAIKELITALLSKKGYKSYSHECLIYFIKEHYKDNFTSAQISLIDELRLLRNDILYRGEFVENDFLERNEKSILDVIKILNGLLK